jgi:hypothetical protein
MLYEGFTVTVCSESFLGYQPCEYLNHKHMFWKLSLSLLSRVCGISDRTTQCMCIQRMLFELNVLKVQATWRTVHKVRPSVITVNGTCTLQCHCLHSSVVHSYLIKAMMIPSQKYIEHSTASKNIPLKK